MSDLATVMEQKDAAIKNLQAAVALEKMKNAGKTRKGRRKRKSTPLDDEFVNLVSSTIKRKCWTKVKLISSPTQLKKVTEYVLRQTGMEGLFAADNTITAEGVKTLNDSQDLVAQKFNELRSSVQNAMKEVGIQWMKDHNCNKLPSEAEIMRIINRDPTMNLDLFEWWWDKFIPKAAGDKSIWPPDNRYFGNISTHAPQSSPTTPYVTASTEAWAALVLDNCHRRWPAIMELKEKNSAKIIYVTGDETPEPKEGIQYVNLEKDAKFAGKYTRIDSGQVAYGGWSTAGYRKFAQLKAANEAGRAKETTLALETEMLARLRTKYKIQGTSMEESRALNKGKKSTPMPEVEEIDDLFDDDIVPV